MKFYILPGTPPPNFRNRDIYNRGYAHFKGTWTKIFNRPHRPQHYDPMGYFRQSYIFQIEDKEKVVAQNCGTQYHLDNLVTEDTPFFENFLGEPITFLKKNMAHSCLSLEYSSVNRRYAPNKVNGLNFYKVIFDLSVRFARTLCIDAIIGHPRRLTKTNEITTDIGYEPITLDKRKYGVSIDVSIGLLDRVTHFPDKDVITCINKLWENRLDCTGLSTGNIEEIYLEYINPLQSESTREIA